MRARAIALSVAATALGSLLLSGCALGLTQTTRGVGGNGFSPEVARSAMFQVLDSTQHVLGGDWDNQDDPTTRTCDLGWWRSGELYPALRVGSAPTDAVAAKASIVSLWHSLGYSVALTEVGSVSQVQGTGPRGQLLIFRVSARAMTLQGESECRPA